MQSQVRLSRSGQLTYGQILTVQFGTVKFLAYACRVEKTEAIDAAAGDATQVPVAADLAGEDSNLSEAAGDLTSARLDGVASETVELGVALVRAAQSHAVRSERILLDGDGLNWLSFRTLYLVWLLEPITARDVSWLLSVSRQTTSNTLQGLEDRGFITRIRDTVDRRRITIRLADAGRAEVDRMVRAQFELDGQWFGVLTAEEQSTLAKLLERVRGGIEQRPTVELRDVLKDAG